MDEIDTIIFAERKQHDAQEFLTYVMDCFHGELTEKAPQGNDGPAPTHDFSMIVKQCLTCRDKKLWLFTVRLFSHHLTCYEMHYKRIMS
jgi:ubiquitin C-terminal hydrolase